ncbi:Fe-S cluster assembly protein SufD [Alkalilacustris brevis]|uniref:Fe-S cluster assembly protein SufD n=1 Tax=Alkalilacustris brevis TaxID=2026338 RepID=UPI000E0DAF9C|nr:Fe-S cluster assembly protein SufD [Alkalilacustris brevis]
MALRREVLLKARQEAASARLDALTLPAGGGWITRAREDALTRLRAMGLPTRRDEYWKFTDPAALVAPATDSAELLGEDPDGTVFDTIDRLKIVFVDGEFDADASDDLAAEGLEITRLAEAARHDLHWARDAYGLLEAEGQAPVERPLAALNTAFATDGVLIRATGKVSRPVALHYLRKDGNADAMVHHCIKLEPGSEMTLLESGAAAARFSQVLEVDVGDGARFNHVRTQGRDHERVSNSNLFARVGEGGVLKSFTLSANGALTRNEAFITLNGRDGVAHIAGAALGDGAFHHDDTVFITHAAPACESRQVYKKVLRGGATGVFQGKILVKQPAQLTDGYQISQALLLGGDDSQFLAKPELEIYADDVKCSHGSTTGEIDPEQLFYLRSRGMPEEEASALLVLAFVAEAIEEIENPDLAEDVRTHLAGWLDRHRG